MLLEWVKGILILLEIVHGRTMLSALTDFTEVSNSDTCAGFAANARTVKNKYAPAPAPATSLMAFVLSRFRHILLHCINMTKASRWRFTRFSTSLQKGVLHNPCFSKWLDQLKSLGWFQDRGIWNKTSLSRRHQHKRENVKPARATASETPEAGTWARRCGARPALPQEQR